MLPAVRTAGRLWTEPTRAESAGFSTDEQNNIDIYKSARDANGILSRPRCTTTRSFFGVESRKRNGHRFCDYPEGEIHK